MTRRRVVGRLTGIVTTEALVPSGLSARWALIVEIAGLGKQLGRLPNTHTCNKDYLDHIFIKIGFSPLFDLIRILGWICTGDALHNPIHCLIFR